jgi:multidrug efflux pump subunit AcrA (membrane-fusion protein)
MRILLGTLVILIGIGLKIGLAALRQPPEQVPVREPRHRVEVMRVRLETVPVLISGYGEVRARDEMTITPKVAGDVIMIHPRLKVGEVIPAGEVLFQIDPQDYEAVLRQAHARVGQVESMLTLLRRQIVLDTQRLETIARSRDIAREEFERDKQLYEQEDIGSRTQVNLTEIKYNEAQAIFEQLSQAVELYPLRVKEAESGLEAAKAAAELAELNLARTVVRAPYDARLKRVHVEVGQSVAPGAPVIVAANDATLEIMVPIDSQDAHQWLLFEDPAAHPAPEAQPVSWFGRLAAAECRITWTEDPGEHVWTGALDRVERFDPATRTVQVAIVLDRTRALAGPDRLPLVEGMFCKVEIPGRNMEDVFRLPRWAVGFDGEIHLAQDERLRRDMVTIVRTQGEEAFVRGLEPGDLVVVTRMVNPLPGILLDYAPPEAEAAAGEPGS